MYNKQKFGKFTYEKSNEFLSKDLSYAFSGHIDGDNLKTEIASRCLKLIRQNSKFDMSTKDHNVKSISPNF